MKGSKGLCICKTDHPGGSLQLSYRCPRHKEFADPPFEYDVKLTGDEIDLLNDALTIFYYHSAPNRRQEIYDFVERREEFSFTGESYE